MTPNPVEIELTGSVATVRLADHAHRNRFTPALQRALPTALAAVSARESVRAVVLEGLADVFCAGGSREELLGQDGRTSTDGWQFVRAPLDCPLPVIAAARGHALGGGLLLALYADLVIFGEQSWYSASFLSYAFTPSLGATYLIPARLGAWLGTEMLYTARPYAGRELAERNQELRAVPNDQVAATAHRLAERVARAPRRPVELLKERLAAPLRQGSRDGHAAELPAHLETITSDAARRAILSRYPQNPMESR